MKKYLVSIVNRNCLESGPAFRLMEANDEQDLGTIIGLEYRNYPHLVVTPVAPVCLGEIKRLVDAAYHSAGMDVRVTLGRYAN